MRAVVILTFLVVLLGSCGVTKDLRRKAKAERKLEQALRLDPSLAETNVTIEYDTILVQDTVIQVEAALDTVVVMQPIDTFMFFDTVTNTEIRIIREVDTFNVNVEVMDTVYLEKEVIVEKEVHTTEIKKRKFYSWLLASWRWLLAVLGIILIIFLGIRIFQK